MCECSLSSLMMMLHSLCTLQIWFPLSWYVSLICFCFRSNETPQSDFENHARRGKNRKVKSQPHRSLKLCPSSHLHQARKSLQVMTRLLQQAGRRAPNIFNTVWHVAVLPSSSMPKTSTFSNFPSTDLTLDKYSPNLEWLLRIRSLAMCCLRRRV